MRKEFLISDTHWGHNGVCHFTNKRGEPLRPWDDPYIMNADMVTLWNDLVSDQDIVWHLGDVVINRRFLAEILPLLRGRKRLVAGNHDIFKLKDYLPYFEDIKGVAMLRQEDAQRPDIVLSHIPLHPDSIARFGTNVHGHYHSNFIDDPAYLCVCVEQTGYRPIELSEVRSRIERNKLHYAEFGHVIDFSLEENW
jgi:calcineurin-like phosphoesterase family protein